MCKYTLISTNLSRNYIEQCLLCIRHGLLWKGIGGWWFGGSLSSITNIWHIFIEDIDAKYVNSYELGDLWVWFIYLLHFS